MLQRSVESTAQSGPVATLQQSPHSGIDGLEDANPLDAQTGRKLVLFLPAREHVLHLDPQRSSRVADVAPHLLAHGAFDLRGERHEGLAG